MKTKRTKTRRATDDELLLCMDYLHGDVVDNEFAAACCYEYERELHVSDKTDEINKEIAQWIEEDEIVFIKEDKGVRGFALRVEEIFRCGLSFTGYARNLIQQCPSFTRKSWNQLSKEERVNILLGFVPRQIQPLQVDEMWLLDAEGIFERLKTMAAKVPENNRPRKPRRKAYPIIEEPPWLRVMFTLNFTKTRKRLLQEFDKWLQLPENKARFDAHAQNPVGKTGLSKDRLKDLAAWRLYRELGRDRALDFAETYRKRDKTGSPRPFHDPRQDQTKKVPLNEAPLYSEESGFLKAKRRAIQFLEVIDLLAECQYGVPRNVEVI
jgi:hypothetical protein